MPHPHVLTFELQQHTPLIHFQPEQEGAGLRATEVKPKLDRYLKSKLSIEDAKVFRSKNPDKKIENLDFSLQITTSGVHSLPIIESDRTIPMFFANMGTDYKERGLNIAEKTELKIICRNSNLKAKISTHITGFFEQTNFGMRSTKGYGSFTVKDSNVTQGQYFSFFVIETTDWRVALRHLELFYKSVRGGINGTKKLSDGTGFLPIYMKPLVFLYAIDQKIKWEKKSIKETPGFKYEKRDKYDAKKDIRDFTLDAQQLKYSRRMTEEQKLQNPLWSSGTPSIVRDLLGLSSEQKWMGYRPEKITKEADGIDRFASPLCFKPVKVKNCFHIYIWAEKIPENYLKSKMKFNIGSPKLELPMWSSFDLPHFMEHYMTVENLNRGLQNGSNNDSGLVEILSKIYQKIEFNKQPKTQHP
jgi:hypothetical protein